MFMGVFFSFGKWLHPLYLNDGDNAARAERMARGNAGSQSL
jgi:hypothetical protein